MGAGLSVSEDTIWFEPPGKSLQEIEIAVDPDSFWYQRIQSVIDAGLNIWNGEVQVGFSDIGGNLDILASLRGTNELLLDLYDHAELVERLMSDVTNAWKQIYQEEVNKIQAVCRGTSPWAPIWSQGTTYMLQSDFSYMISPRMFERFVLPDLAALCEIMDDPFYHLDGKGEILHLDLLLSLEQLKGVQWIPGDGQPPADHWLGLLKRIRDAGKFCQVFISPQGAKTIINELGGTGFIFAINDENLTPEEAQQLYKDLIPILY
jgi:5-methyltetrahydrofolate--homocysteine methyltransferase